MRAGGLARRDAVIVSRAASDGTEKAGLVEVYTDDDDGQQIMRLTPKGERVARQLAMTDEDGQDALMGALLEDEG